MGDVEEHRVFELLHDAEAEHVDDQVVVAEGRAALAEDQLVITRLLALLQDVLHLLRCEKLRFLDVDHRTGLGHRHHQVGLPREEGRQLDDVADIGDRLRLPWLVHISNDRDTKGFLHFLEDLHALFQARAAEGGDRGAVGLVEARLEHVGNAELLGHPHIFFTGLHGQIPRFEDIDAAEQHERLVVGDLDVAYANGLLAHAFFALYSSAALTKPLNSGCPSRGVDVNSGWN